MPTILLINPNASEATTTMMADIAQRSAPAQWQILPRTAGRGPSMIVNATELAQAALEVEDCWREAPSDCAGIIISAFGDPGLERLRGAVRKHLPRTDQPPGQRGVFSYMPFPVKGLKERI